MALYAQSTHVSIPEITWWDTQEPQCTMVGNCLLYENTFWFWYKVYFNLHPNSRKCACVKIPMFFPLNLHSGFIQKSRWVFIVLLCIKLGRQLTKFVSKVRKLTRSFWYCTFYGLFQSFSSCFIFLMHFINLFVT